MTFLPMAMDGVLRRRMRLLQILYFSITATVLVFLFILLCNTTESPGNTNIHRIFTFNESATCEIFRKSSPAVAFPRIIHQTWKDRNIPEKWQKMYEGCRQLNPTYKFILWTDADLEKFIAEKYPWFLETYKSYPYPIQRVDAARYFILHYYGGVYIDLDIKCNVPIDDLLYTIPPDKDCVLGATIPVGVTNSMMISKPRHPFMLYIISRLESVNGWYVLPYWTIMFSTGPLMVWRGYTQYPCQTQVVVLSVQEHNTKYFQHTHGSSWHQYTWDAPLMVFLDAHLLSVIVFGLFLVTLIIVLIYKRCATKKSRHIILLREYSGCNPITFY